MSSNDFGGSPFGPGSGRGADEQGAGAAYPAPEGWSNDGVWRDSAMDSNYQTSVQPAIRPTPAQPDTGYTYWSDGQGWQSKPGAGQAPGTPAAPVSPAAPASPALDETTVGGTSISATSANPAAPAAAGYGANAQPTAVYQGGAGGYGGPAGGGPVGGGYGGYGAGGPVVPGGPGWTGGPGGPGAPGGPGRPGLPFGLGGPGGPRRPSGPRVKGKGDWWRHWTWKKAAIVAGGVFAFFVIAMYGTYEYLYDSTTIPQALASETAQDSIVYYSDGTTVMGTIGQTNRQDLPLNQIPTTLQNAYLAAEDKNFFTEGGISPTGILRAALHDVVSGGDDLNGGSTITQEFVRNYYGLGLEQTASRKIREIFIAEKLSNTKSKDWILDSYLNVVQEGDNSYGVEAAAETYFGLPVSKLSLSQDAILASMPQAPSLLPEESDKAGLENRWNDVLDNMVKDGFITQAQRNAAKFPTLRTWADPAVAENASDINPGNPNEAWEPYLLSQVENELVQDDGLTESELSTGGYKIVTTISRPMEEQMYAAVDNTLSASAISTTPGSTVSSLPSWALVGAELQDPKTGAIIAEYPGKGQNMTASACAAADCDDNTAAYTREPVGSSFKPYVLSTAVQQGMNVMTSTLDTSPYLCVAPDGSSAYSVPLTANQYAADNMGSPDCSSTLAEGYPVENDGGELIGKKVGQATSGANKGATYYSDNVQSAIAFSSNTGFTDLTHKVGTANVIQMAENFGVDGSADGGADFAKYQGEVGLALGIASLTVQEQDTMLATLADNGYYHQSHLIKYWQKPGAGSAEVQPKLDSHMVLTPQQAGDVQYAMEATTTEEGATAFGSVTYGADTPGMVISKTGTTTDSKSGFFIGATTQYALVVGMFAEVQSDSNPDNLSMLGGGGFGGYWPAKVWNALATTAFPQSPQLFTTSPDTAGQQTWNLLGTVPKAAKKTTTTCTPTTTGHGRNKFNITGQNCSSPNAQTGVGTDNGGLGATPTPTATAMCPNGSTPTADPSGDGRIDCNGRPTNSATCSDGSIPTVSQSSGQVVCDANGAGTPTPATSATGAFAGGALFLPGSVLLTGVTRRRKRKNRTRKAE